MLSFFTILTEQKSDKMLKEYFYVLWQRQRWPNKIILKINMSTKTKAKIKQSHTNDSVLCCVDNFLTFTIEFFDKKSNASPDKIW